MPNQGALANMDIDGALDLISSGVMCKQIAATYGVTPRAIRAKLEKHPEYKAAVASQASAFVEDAVREMIDCPADPVLIARARAKADVVLRYAKAHNPAYADKLDASALQVVINIAREGATGTAERVGATMGAAVQIDRLKDDDNQ